MSLRDRLKKGPDHVPSQVNVEPQQVQAAGPAEKPAAPQAPAQSGSAPQQAGSTSNSAPPPVKKPPQGVPTITTQSNTSKGERFDEVKTKVHGLMVDNLNISPTDTLSNEDVMAAANQFLERYLAQEKIPMGHSERRMLVQELVEEVVGLGPLEPLLRDESITEIMINGCKKVYIERSGKLFKTDVTFKDEAHLMHIIERIVSNVGRRVDEKTPMVDARLKDGSRFNAIIPPLAIDGASVTIRKFKKDAGTLEKLLNWGSLTAEMATTLEAAVKCHLNIVISGGTGSGKTTMLNSLSAIIAPDERIVTIEDSAELQLRQDHVVRLETRPPNIEGSGAITARQLLINSLRMRPDRIVVGECRGGETVEMLQAMNTGHDGSLTTLHANSPRDAMARIVTMCMMVDNPLPETTIRQQIASAVHMIVQVSRLMDGQRKTMSIAEITGMEGDIITMQEIFKYNQIGVDDNGKVIGHHVCTGIRPRFADLAKAKGVHLPEDLFIPQEQGAAGGGAAGGGAPKPKKDRLDNFKI